MAATVAFSDRFWAAARAAALNPNAMLTLLAIASCAPVPATTPEVRERTGLGRDAHWSALRKLDAAGLIARSQGRTDANTFAKEYITLDIVSAARYTISFPCTENQGTASIPVHGKPVHGPVHGFSGHGKSPCTDFQCTAPCTENQGTGNSADNQALSAKVAGKKAAASPSFASAGASTFAPFSSTEGRRKRQLPSKADQDTNVYTEDIKKNIYSINNNKEKNKEKKSKAKSLSKQSDKSADDSATSASTKPKAKSTAKPKSKAAAKPPAELTAKPRKRSIAQRFAQAMDEALREHIGKDIAKWGPRDHRHLKNVRERIRARLSETNGRDPTDDELLASYQHFLKAAATVSDGWFLEKHYDPSGLDSQFQKIVNAYQLQTTSTGPSKRPGSQARTMGGRVHGSGNAASTSVNEFLDEFDEQVQRDYERYKSV